MIFIGRGNKINIIANNKSSTLKQNEQTLVTFEEHDFLQLYILTLRYLKTPGK